MNEGYHRGRVKGPSHLHAVVEDLGGNLVAGRVAAPTRLKADAVNRGVDLSLPDNGGDGVREVPGLHGPQVDGLAAEGASLGQALGDHVADDDAGGSEEVSGGGGGESDGAGAGDVDCGAGLHAGCDGAVVAGGEDVGEEGQVRDLIVSGIHGKGGGGIGV